MNEKHKNYKDYGVKIKVKLSDLKRDFKSLPQYIEIVEGVIKESAQNKPYIVANEEGILYISPNIDAGKIGQNVAKIDPKYIIREKALSTEEIIAEYEQNFASKLDLMRMKRSMLSETNIGMSDNDDIELAMFHKEPDNVNEDLAEENTQDKSKEIMVSCSFSFYTCLNLSDCENDNEDNISAYCKDEILEALDNWELYDYVREISLEDVTIVDDYTENNDYPTRYNRLSVSVNCVISLPDYYFTDNKEGYEESYAPEFKKILTSSLETALSEGEHNCFVDKPEMNEFTIQDIQIVDSEQKTQRQDDGNTKNYDEMDAITDIPSAN